MPKDYFDDTNQAPQQAPQQQTAERSIRNIPISVGRPAQQRTTQTQRPQSGRQIFQQRMGEQGPSTKGRLVLWTAAIVGILALMGLALLPFLKGTTVTVVPRTHTVVFDEQSQYVAYPQGATDIPDGALIYTNVTKEFTESTPVSASGTERTEDYASGTITVYNNHSSSAVRLIKNTRFETPDGKIYRIRNSISVPGKQGSAPGSITVTVYADQPGDAYNIAPVNRFTLPGLKTGAPEMFANVYAQSSSSMSGGFVGERPIVPESELKKAQENLRLTLKQKAEAEASSLSVSGIAFPQLLTVVYTALAPEKQTDGSVTVAEKAVVTIPVFETLAFAKALAVSNSAEAGKASINIPDTTTFSIAVAQGYETGKPITFNLAGSATFLWDVDIISFAQALAGTKKATFPNVVSSFESIDTADAYIRPFWRSTFPDSPEDIEIIIGGGQQQ